MMYIFRNVYFNKCVLAVPCPRFLKNDHDVLYWSNVYLYWCFLAIEHGLCSFYMLLRQIGVFIALGWLL